MRNNLVEYEITTDPLYGNPMVCVYDLQGNFKGSVVLTRDEYAGFNQWCYSDDVNIQDALPHLSDDDRELLLTGITPEEWEEMFWHEEDF